MTDGHCAASGNHNVVDNRQTQPRPYRNFFFRPESAFRRRSRDKRIEERVCNLRSDFVTIICELNLCSTLNIRWLT